MALIIQKRSWKTADGSTSESWRLIVEDYTTGKKRCFYPKKAQYSQWGLDASDSYSIAFEKLKTVRARDKIQKTAVRRARIDKRLKEQDLKESAYLPRELYKRYLIWLSDRRMWGEIPSKSISHLRCMRKLILDLDVDPSEWPDRPEKIYGWFRKKKLSLSFLKKVLPLINEYGYFYCREFKKPFLKIPFPRGEILHKIEDANLEHRDGRQAPSAPMLEKHLHDLADIQTPQLRWMRFSFYFGLRPEEIDKLILRHRGKLWDIRKDDRGNPYLAIYQTKLTSVERNRRWKRIPVILPEQERLIRELEKGEDLKRPILKVIKSRLGEKYGVYAGRKGFEKFMRSKGQKNDNISRWLGHLDFKRTEQNYREIEAVEYDPVK